eukprot:11415750-Alexandrium_andersonii.AAC.1
MDAHPGHQFLVCGDLNAEPSHIQGCASLLAESRLIDLGARASMWGQERDGVPTCRAPNAR